MIYVMHFIGLFDAAVNDYSVIILMSFSSSCFVLVVPKREVSCVDKHIVHGKPISSSCMFMQGRLFHVFPGESALEAGSVGIDRPFGNISFNYLLDEILI